MATVPRIAAPTVEARPTPFVQQTAEGATPDAFGAANARGMIQAGERLANFGEQVFRTAERIRYDEDQRAVTENLTLLDKERLRIVRGDGTAENPGFYGQNGQNAIDGYAPSRKALDEARDRIAKDMKSDRARQLFLQGAERRIVAEDENMIGHVTRQRTVAANAADKVAIDTATGEIAAFYNDPKREAELLAGIEARVVAGARRNGVTDQATIDGLVLAQRSEVARSAIDTALKRDDVAGAQEVFRRFAGKIDGRVEAGLANVLRDKVVVEESQRAADEVWAEAKRSGWSETRTREEVAKRFSGKLEDAVMTRLNSFFSSVDQDRSRGEAALGRERRTEEEAAIAELDRLRMSGMTPQEQREAAKEVKGRAGILLRSRLETLASQDAAEQRRLNSEALASALEQVEAGTDPRALPRDLYSRLSREQREGLEKRFRAVQSGAPTASVPGAREAYMSKSPQEAAAVDLSVARLELSDQDYAVVRDYVTRMQRDPQGADAINRSSDAQYIGTRLTGLNFTGKAKQDDRARLFEAIDREVLAARQGNDGRLSPQERERIVNDAVKLYVSERAWYDPRGGRLENQTRIQEAANLSSEQLRVRQNLPVLQRFAAQQAPGRAITAADAAAVEAIRLGEYTGQERANFTRGFRESFGRSPTTYELRAYIYLIENSGEK